MKRIILFGVLSCVFLTAAFSQPFNVKKVSKAVFTLKTFNAEGALIASNNGFFIGDDGMAVSSFEPFRGASRAVVIDAQGKEWPVEAICGANDSYDVAKFRVGIKKVQGLAVASVQMTEGSECWLLAVGTQRAVTAEKATVRRVENFRDEYAYYTLARSVSIVAPATDAESCPLLNADGQVVGIMQRAASVADSLSYAVDGRFADSLRITGLSINDRALRSVLIKKALPEQKDQALLTLYVAGASTDSATYATMVDDFIAQFPDAPDGYEYRAQLKASANDFAGAQKDMERAISVAEQKDEVHLSYSRLIFQKELYKNDIPYEPWSLDKAYEEAGKAYELNPLPIYRRQQAQVCYAQKKYDEAYRIYEQLMDSPLRAADLFFEASRCKEQLRDTMAQLALLDSAVCQFSRPYLQEAAPYLLARAQVRHDAGKYRDAVNDLNDYESLMRSRLTDHFYYIRFQAEVGGRLYQQALDDIDKAIGMSPEYDLYYAEKASLEIRVGLYEDAIVTAEQCIKVAPDYSDGYLFLGLAQCLKGQKEEGLKNLQKAKELGDPQAEGLIEKYAQ